MALEKVDGIESVDVSLAKAAADIRLEPGNAVTLPLLREIVRRAGYATRDARLEGRGVFIERGGRPALDLENGSFLELAAKPSATPAGAVDVTGVSRIVDKRREVLTITAPK